jgi:hypothetical protein
MPFVVNASVAAGWAFEDEAHLTARLVLQRIRSGEARVPRQWGFEVRKILIVHERHGRLAETDTAAFRRGLSRAEVTVDRAPEEVEVMTLERR